MRPAMWTLTLMACSIVAWNAVLPRPLMALSLSLISIMIIRETLGRTLDHVARSRIDFLLWLGIIAFVGVIADRSLRILA